MTSRERNDLGIARKLPEGVDMAMVFLGLDKKLKARIGEACIAKYITMKKAEIAALEEKEETSVWKWIIDRY